MMPSSVIEIRQVHLALQLPEIVGNILSYLVPPNNYFQDEINNQQINKRKVYQHIYPCLFVNGLWHDCASRIIWRYITFEDTNTDYIDLIKLSGIISDKETSNAILSSNQSDSLTIKSYKSSPRLKTFLTKANIQQPSLVFYKRKIHAINKNSPPIKHLKQQFDLKLNASFKRFLPSPGVTTINEEYYSLIFNNRHQPHNSFSFSHQTQNRNAIRSFTLRKIKEKKINDPLEQIGRCMPKLEKLDIYICDHLLDRTLQSFIRHSVGNLTFLSLAGCNRITDKAILSVSENCPKLEHLDLRACGHISDVSIKAIAHQCPELRHLNVGRVRDRERITIKSIRWIAVLTKISVLGLAGCDMTDECLVLLAKTRGAGIERVSVNNCYQLTNKTVQAYVQYCPNLTVFEIKECHWINDWRSVANLVERKVLLTLCDQQNKACAEWARRSGRIIEVRAPVK